MRCPKCGGKTSCVDSRWVQESWRQRRRHQCGGCGNRFTTFEVCDGANAGLITARDRIALRATAVELRRRADALDHMGRGVEICLDDDRPREGEDAA